VRESIAALPALPGNAFWLDDIGPLDPDCMNSTRPLSSAQPTDTYLLALAPANRGQLASFDRHLIADTVPDGFSPPSSAGSSETGKAPDSAALQWGRAWGLGL
jgi:hypothetical protein